MSSVQDQIQAGTAEWEKVGVFITTEEVTYFTDESPEHHNKPGNRFTMTAFQRDQRLQYGNPNISPRFFRTVTTVIVNREEISEKEWLKDNPLPVTP